MRVPFQNEQEEVLHGKEKKEKEEEMLWKIQKKRKTLLQLSKGLIATITVDKYKSRGAEPQCKIT